MFGKRTNKPQNQIDSLISMGTHVVGDISFNGGLRVDGHVRGNITVMGDKPSTLMLSDRASVEGKIKVSHAVINGTVVGTVHADEYLELQAKARVSRCILPILGNSAWSNNRRYAATPRSCAARQHSDDIDTCH